MKQKNEWYLFIFKSFQGHFCFVKLTLFYGYFMADFIVLAKFRATLEKYWIYHAVTPEMLQ